MWRVGATHFNEEGLAGWVNEQFGLVQLAPKRQAYQDSQQWNLTEIKFVITVQIPSQALETN